MLMLMLLYSLIIVDSFIFGLVVYIYARSSYRECEKKKQKERDSSVICTQLNDNKHNC